jgi:hypothetical protein
VGERLGSTASAGSTIPTAPPTGCGQSIGGGERPYIPVLEVSAGEVCDVVFGAVVSRYARDPPDWDGVPMADKADKKADKKVDKHVGEPRFTVPMPGGKVARVPVPVLQKYLDGSARYAHAAAKPPGDSGSSITIHIHPHNGEVRVERGRGHEAGDHDVVAHSMSTDLSTGTSEWHTDWEYGECEYTDESGFPQRIQAWHRHPFGTEYAELYEG